MRGVLKISVFWIAGIGLTEMYAQSSPNQDSIKRFNRHDFISRGNHPNEMALGTFVIVGTTLTEKDAQLMLKQLKKLKYPEPSYAYITNKSFWYIYYGPFQDIEEAKVKRDEFRQYKMYQNARLLTVHQ